MTPRDVLRRVRRLEIRTRGLVDGALAGSYHAVFRGRGMEFSEVRPYEPGDDVRTVDGNVSARMGHPYVKVFVEERELTVVLAVDFSGSVGFGTGGRTKREVAAEVSALLAFSALRNNDRVGLLSFTDRIEAFVPPRRGREHALRVLRDVLAFEPKGRGTDLGAALTFLRRALTRRAVVFVLSDFQAVGWERALRVAARKHDVVAIAVDDPRERALPSVGMIAARDPETGREVLVDAGSAAVRRSYAALAAGQRDALRALLRSVGVDLLELSTGTPYDRTLLRFFRERARRLARVGA